MLRIYQSSATGLNGEQLRNAFRENIGMAQVTRFEGMEAIDYAAEGRAAVIGPSWNGNVLYYAIVCM